MSCSFQSLSHVTASLHTLEGTSLLEYVGGDIGYLWLELDESLVDGLQTASDVQRLSNIKYTNMSHTKSCEKMM